MATAGSECPEEKHLINDSNSLSTTPRRALRVALSGILAACLALSGAVTAAGPPVGRPVSVTSKTANKLTKAAPEPAVHAKRAGSLIQSAPVRVPAPKALESKQLASPTEAGNAPLPLVRPPGTFQPVVPGHRPTAALPEIVVKPPIPELKRAEYASNGYIEVAGDLILVPNANADLISVFNLAREAVKRTFQARPSLSEVDVTVYVAESYAGFGGPLPLFSASIPGENLASFLALAPTAAGTYDRAWVNAAAYPTVVQPQPQSVPADALDLNPLGSVTGNKTGRVVVQPPNPAKAGAPNAKPLRAKESAPTMYGSPAEVVSQQVKQLASQTYGEARRGVFFHGDPTSGMAALSFDDAPHPIYEPLLLDLLRRFNVKATFFVIGRNAQAFPYFVRDMKNAGMEIGNHTYHHVRLPTLSEADIRAELLDASRVIEAITGQPIEYFRPPGGEYSPTVLRVASELGLTTAFWTDDPADFNNPGNVQLEWRLTRHLRPGGIVLLHDNVLESINVLPSFLRVASSRRVTLSTVGALASVGRF